MWVTYVFVYHYKKITNFKKIMYIWFVFFCFSPSYEKSDRKKRELEISTLDKVFVGQK